MAFKQKGFSYPGKEPSPNKFLGKIARGVSRLFGRKKRRPSSGIGLRGISGIKERMKKAMEARRRKMAELEDLESFQGAKGYHGRKLTSKESASLDKMRRTHDNLPEQG